MRIAYLRQVMVGFLLGLLIAMSETSAKEVNRAEANGAEVSIGVVTASDSISLLHFEGAFYKGNSKVLNFYGINYSSEWLQLFTTEHPSVKKVSIFTGHQFRFRWKSLFLPLSVGISGGAGIDRGSLIRTTREDSTCLLCHSDEIYKKREFVYTGAFLQITPSLYFRGLHIGIKYIASIDTRHMAYGGGISFGIPLEAYHMD